MDLIEDTTKRVSVTLPGFALCSANLEHLSSAGIDSDITQRVRQRPLHAEAAHV